MGDVFEDGRVGLQTCVKCIRWGWWYVTRPFRTVAPMGLPVSRKSLRSLYRASSSLPVRSSVTAFSMTT